MTDLEGGLHRPPSAELDWRALTASLSRRAGEAGLLDVAYAETDSPIGELIVFVTPRGLLRVKYADEPIEDVLADVAARVSPRILRAPSRAWLRHRGSARDGKHPLRRRAHVRADRCQGRLAARGSRGRQRPGLEPDPDRGAVPSRAPRGRWAGRLFGRPRSEALPAGARGLAPEARLTSQARAVAGQGTAHDRCDNRPRDPHQEAGEPSRARLVGPLEARDPVGVRIGSGVDRPHPDSTRVRPLHRQRVRPVAPEGDLRGDQPGHRGDAVAGGEGHEGRCEPGCDRRPPRT